VNLCYFRACGAVVIKILIYYQYAKHIARGIGLWHIVIICIFISGIPEPPFLAIAASYCLLRVPLFIVYVFYNKIGQLTTSNYRHTAFLLSS
jgi:hypothetical protein